MNNVINVFESLNKLLFHVLRSVSSSIYNAIFETEFNSILNDYSKWIIHELASYFEYLISFNIFNYYNRGESFTFKLDGTNISIAICTAFYLFLFVFGIFIFFTNVRAKNNSFTRSLTLFVALYFLLSSSLFGQENDTLLNNIIFGDYTHYKRVCSHVCKAKLIIISAVISLIASYLYSIFKYVFIYIICISIHTLYSQASSNNNTLQFVTILIILIIVFYYLYTYLSRSVLATLYSTFGSILNIINLAVGLNIIYNIFIEHGKFSNVLVQFSMFQSICFWSIYFIIFIIGMLFQYRNLKN